MRDEPEAEIRCLTTRSFRYHKRCWLMKTAGRWSWKSKSAKECVTTYLSNDFAPKMDDAEAYNSHTTVAIAVGRQRVGLREECVEPLIREF